MSVTVRKRTAKKAPPRVRAPQTCAWCIAPVTPKTGIRMEDIEATPHFFHAPMCVMLFQHFIRCPNRARA